MRVLKRQVLVLVIVILLYSPLKHEGSETAKYITKTTAWLYSPLKHEGSET